MKTITKWMLGSGTLGISAAVLFPVFATTHCGPGPAGICRINLKHLGVACLMYAEDSNGHLPLRDNWREATAEYGYTDQRKCTELGELGKQYSNAFGYAFNSKLSGKTTKRADEASMPMLYDSINLAASASDPFTSLPLNGRHKGTNTIVYLDGHIKSVKTP